MMQEQAAIQLEKNAQQFVRSNPTKSQAMLLEAAEIYLRLAEHTRNPRYMVKAQQLYQESEKVSRGPINLPNQSGLNVSKIIAKEPSVTFDDIAGLESLKKQIRLKIIEPFKNPGVYQYFNKKIGGGILMYGPPGCGKSLIAEAAAAEADATFFSVKASDLKSKFVGETEKNISELFEEARKRAPSIIFFDEFEALGEARSSAHETNKGMISQLLTEMDGVGNKDQQILLLAATNEPWQVDLALKREGRFGQVLFVPPPDFDAREGMLSIHLKDTPVDQGVNKQKLALLTENFSGADMKSLANMAIDRAIEESLASGNLRKVTMDDFLIAIKKKKPTTIPWYKQAMVKAHQSGEAEMFAEMLEAGSKALEIAG